MLKSIALVLLAGLSRLALGSDTETLDAQDTAVLSAVVQSLCERPSKLPGYKVLSDESFPVGDDEGKASLNGDAVKSLAQRNKIPHPLPQLVLCSRIVLAKKLDITSAFRQVEPGDDEGMSGFYKAFPGASDVLDLSLPGYAENGAMALVVVGGTKGSFYWILRKVDGRWVVERSVHRSIG